MAKRSGSSAPGARGRKKGSRTRRPIDYSDIPELSAKQLRSMKRVGRPPLGDGARQLIAIRLDTQVLQALRLEAERRSLGYQTLVNEVLADYVRRRAS
jgi:uncharacterized protein (DUF4415 family)